MGYRNDDDVATGIMIHVGGNYEKNGSNRVAAQLRKAKVRIMQDWL